MKRWLARLAALALGLLLVALLLEGALRVLRPGVWERPALRTADGRQASDLSEVIGFLKAREDQQGLHSITQLAAHMDVLGCYDRPRWNYFDEQGCVHYRTNSLGFRDDEFPLRRPPGERRVIAIGDSFTFGIGVTQRDTWAQVLERGLAAAWGAPVQVINAGFTAGYLPPHYTPWLLATGVKLDPELVIVGLCLNDLGEIPMLAYGFDQPESGSLLVDWVRRRLARWRVDAAIARQASDPKAKRFDFMRVIDRAPQTWKDTGAALVAAKKGLAARGIDFMVAVLPMLSQLDSDYPYQSLHDMVDRFCEQQGIGYVDLGPRFRGLRDTELWAHPTDQHPNDRAQAMLGQGILAAVLKRDD